MQAAGTDVQKAHSKFQDDDETDCFPCCDTPYFYCVGVHSGFAACDIINIAKKLPFDKKQSKGSVS